MKHKKSRKNFSKKAQTEIIGLVIIVLIVTVAMMFYLSFKTNPENSTKKTLYQEYAYNEIATSFAQTLLNTYVFDCRAKVKDLLIDCGSLRGGRIYCSDGRNSCEALNDTVVYIKNQTLDVWNYPYGLSIKIDGHRKLEFVKYNCTTDTVGRGTPGVFPTPYYPDPGMGVLEIGICKY